jgi:hypothetical protein
MPIGVQGIERARGLDVNATAVSSVSAIGAAHFDKFFATEADCSSTAVASFYKNLQVVEKQLFGGVNVDESAVLAFVLKSHLASNFGE